MKLHSHFLEVRLPLRKNEIQKISKICYYISKLYMKNIKICSNKDDTIIKFKKYLRQKSRLRFLNLISLFFHKNF